MMILPAKKVKRHCWDKPKTENTAAQFAPIPQRVSISAATLPMPPRPTIITVKVRIFS
jgi:hypothetical protein